MTRSAEEFYARNGWDYPPRPPQKEPGSPTTEAELLTAVQDLAAEVRELKAAMAANLDTQRQAVSMVVTLGERFNRLPPVSARPADKRFSLR